MKKLILKGSKRNLFFTNACAFCLLNIWSPNKKSQAEKNIDEKNLVVLSLKQKCQKKSSDIKIYLEDLCPKTQKISVSQKTQLSAFNSLELVDVHKVAKKADFCSRREARNRVSTHLIMCGR